MSNAQDASRGGQASGGRPAGDDIQARLRRLEELADLMEKAKVGGRNIRWLVAVLLILIVVGVGLRIYGFYGFVQANAAAYQAAFTQEMVSFAEKAANELTGVAREVAPAFREAVQKDWEQNGEEIVKKLRAEAETFADSGTKKLKVRLTDELKTTVTGYEKKMEEAFPRLKDAKMKERVVETLRVSLSSAAAALIEKHLNEYLALISGIYDEAIKFLPTKEAQDELNKSLGLLFKPIEKAIQKPAVTKPAK